MNNKNRQRAKRHIKIMLAIAVDVYVTHALIMLIARLLKKESKKNHALIVMNASILGELGKLIKNMSVQNTS